MTATLSPPVRVFAFIGALAATGLAAFFFLAGRGAVGADDSGSPTASVPGSTPTAQPTARPKPAPRPPAPPKPATRPKVVTTKSGFPLAVDRALRNRRVVVIVVHTPGAAVDRIVLTEARAAAKTSRAALVSIRVTSERAVRTLVAKTGVLPSPAVLVVKRPGRVAATLGVTDRETIAQAIVQAKR